MNIFYFFSSIICLFVFGGGRGGVTERPAPCIWVVLIISTHLESWSLSEDLFPCMHRYTRNPVVATITPPATLERVGLLAQNVRSPSILFALGKSSAPRLDLMHAFLAIHSVHRHPKDDFFFLTVVNYISKSCTGCACVHLWSTPRSIHSGVKLAANFIFILKWTIPKKYLWWGHQDEIKKVFLF